MTNSLSVRYKGLKSANVVFTALLCWIYICDNICSSFDMTTADDRRVEKAGSLQSLPVPQKLHESYSPHDDDYDDEEEEEDDVEDLTNGTYIGSPCDSKFPCSPHLQNVFCDSSTNTCGCEKDFPVILGLRKGCAKPKKLGEQCFYHQSCAHSDPNSLCVQVRHVAKCECADGYHTVSFSKPTRRVFCTQDLEAITSKLPTLLGVVTSIGVLGGLICMVLYLFSKNKYQYPQPREDTHLGPPVMYSGDSARPSSRSSQRSSGSIGSFSNRRASGVPYSHGSRRPSLASVQSSSSSVKSYSMRRFEQELHQKELRVEMKKQLTKLQEQQQLQRATPCIIVGDTIPFTVTRTILPTPSPLTPKSTDELLPSVCEEQEFSPSLSNKSASSTSNASSSLMGRPSTSTDLLQ